MCAHAHLLCNAAEIVRVIVVGNVVASAVAVQRDTTGGKVRVRDEVVC
jgi:hypothetical protein